MSKSTSSILEVKGLKKYYETTSGFIDSLIGSEEYVKAVDGIDLELKEGETLGVVGESGCGKTTLGRSILRLIEPTEGTVQYNKESGQIDITELSSSELRSLRTDLQYIFQDPFSSLNPRLTVGDIITEPLEIHNWPWTDESVQTDAEVRVEGVSTQDITVNVADDIDKVVEPKNGIATAHVEVRKEDGEYIAEAEENLVISVSEGSNGLIVDVEVGRSDNELRQHRVKELLKTVGLDPNHVHRYPHEFSGGQRQRIGIARSLAVDPEVIICDEPVSALDVSIQAQILNLLEDLQEEFGLSYIFIAHDLSVVEHISDRIAVMYLGNIVEIGETDEIFSEPHHPYVEALLSAIPEPDPEWDGDRVFLPGTVPSPINPPSGCRFHTRCPKIIQPEKYDLDQEIWRSLFDFRLRVEEIERPSGLFGVADDESVADAGRDEIEDAIRDEFELPSQIDNASVEETVTEAIDYVATGDIDAAEELLKDTFQSPCEREDPPAVKMSDSHQISCLLFDENDGYNQ